MGKHPKHFATFFCIATSEKNGARAWQLQKCFINQFVINFAYAYHFRGFCIGGSGRTHIFKPVSVQAMWYVFINHNTLWNVRRFWQTLMQMQTIYDASSMLINVVFFCILSLSIFDRSALQTLHKVCAKARENNLYPSRPSHEWAVHYDDRINSDQSCLNEWNAMDSLETRRPPSPDAIRNKYAPFDRLLWIFVIFTSIYCNYHGLFLSHLIGQPSARTPKTPFVQHSKI